MPQQPHLHPIITLTGTMADGTPGAPSSASSESFKLLGYINELRVKSDAALRRLEVRQSDIGPQHHSRGPLPTPLDLGCDTASDIKPQMPL
jgi:hypothetical protein